MSLAWIVALAAVAQAPPPVTEEEEDIMLIDKPEMSRMELEAARFERHVMNRAPQGAIELVIARGDTLFVETDIPLLRAPKGPLEAKPTDVRGSKDIRLAPWLEPVPAATPEKAQTRMLYAVRVAPNAPLGRQRIVITLNAYEREDGSAIGTKQLLHTVDVRAVETDVDQLRLNKRAYLYHQTLALEAYKNLRSLHDYLRLDRVDPPPSAKRVSEKDRPQVESFFNHRLRADIARDRLRAAAELADPKLAVEAVLALGGLSKKPIGPAARATVIDGEPAARAIEMARALLDDLKIDEAEGILARLRKSGTLTREELARVIDLTGAVYAARGRDEDAKAEHGRALCIDPKLELGLTRPPLVLLVKQSFEKERVTRGSCTNRLAVSTITAVRAPSERGVVITVRAIFGPDPRELIAGGDIELWGGGGGRLKAEKVRAIHDGSGMGALEAVFPDSGDLENYSGQLLLKIFVRDLSGVVIADAGHPDPLATAVTAAPELGGIDLPWWAYAIAGGVALIGTAVTVAVVQGNRELARGIGPITVEF